MNRGAWWATVHGVAKSWAWGHKESGMTEQLTHKTVWCPKNLLTGNASNKAAIF